MDQWFSQVVICCITALGGLLAGWLLHRARPTARLLQDVDDVQLARELMTSLHRLSVRMAADVDQHQSRVGLVDQELAATSTHSAAGVNGLVNRLMAANEEVRAKLSQAESKLDELTVKMESHATEARTDVLTGMPNRRAYIEEAAKRFVESQETGTDLSLVIVDIDEFKQVNDQYGHTLGDKVLRRVGATLLANSCWHYFASRYGGEEFAILLPGTAVDEARRYAEDLRTAVQNTRYRVGGTMLGLTISAGAAQLLPAEDMNALVQRTDQAMYAAKHAGRNCVYWHDGTSPQPLGRDADSSPETEIDSPSVPMTAAEATTPVKAAPAEVAEAAPRAVVPMCDVDVLQPESIDLDLLNNLSNKTMFCQHVHRRISEFHRGGPTFSTVLLNVDNYTPLARDHGLPAAELALGVVTQAIRDRVRTMDLVARYNETTFALILPGATLRSAVCIGERLRKEVHRSSIMIDGHNIRFTVSLGIVEVAEGDEMATHVERASAQLACASKCGGNRTGFAAAPAAS